MGLPFGPFPLAWHLRVVNRGAMGEELAVRTVGLGKTYGGTVALQDVDLTIGRGEVFGYLGPNGAGKTTTLRLLRGMLRPTAVRAQNAHQ